MGIGVARKLRQISTIPEIKLWQYLRDIGSNGEIGVLRKSCKDEELQQRFYDQLLTCDIADMLRLVKKEIHYSSVFTYKQMRYSKLTV